MGKGYLVPVNIEILLFGGSLKSTNDFESNFYTIAVWFLSGRHPLVSFVRYSHCLYHLVIKMGQKKILQQLQVGPSLNTWIREEFKNFCYLAWRDLELAPSSSRCFFCCCCCFFSSISFHWHNRTTSMVSLNYITF